MIDVTELHILILTWMTSVWIQFSKLHDYKKANISVIILL